MAGLLLALSGGCDRPNDRSESHLMSAPEKIRLIPDLWHIHNVGQLKDGRLFFVDQQLVPSSKRPTKDYVCTFVFDQDGHLGHHSIDYLGERGGYPDANVSATLARHLAALGDHTVRDIWVRPFSVMSDGVAFGLIPRQAADGSWRVEFMPGNTLSFIPPWELGEYDT